MKEILKPIFEWLTGNYSLFDNVLYNYVAMGIVGLISFSVAWNIVGSLYKNDVIMGRSAGSIIHWIVRFISFVVIFSAISIVIWIIKLIFAIPVWIWWTLLGILLSVITIFIVGHFFKKDGTHK